MYMKQEKGARLAGLIIPFKDKYFFLQCACLAGDSKHVLNRLYRYCGGFGRPIQGHYDRRSVIQFY
jgi:hypothetical protein